MLWLRGDVQRPSSERIVSANPLPSCGGKDMQRLLPRIGVIFQREWLLLDRSSGRESGERARRRQSETAAAAASKAEFPGE